jgi:hypothetical protein
MERRNGPSSITMGLLCFSLGMNLTNFIRTATDNADERVRDIQTRNEQLYDQLSETHESLGSLVLNDEKDSFTFVLSQGTDLEQTCEGSYEISNNTAVAIGDIVCSVSTPTNITTTTIG